MKMMRTVMALAFVVALAACNQNAAKTDAPADAAAAPATDANGKPAEPVQAPADAAPDKPS
jgi:uncharacterized lipoprotein YbaY